MRLRDGIVLLQVGDANNANGTKEYTLDSPVVHVNDGDWYQLVLWSSRVNGTVLMVRHADSKPKIAENSVKSKIQKRNATS